MSAVEDAEHIIQYVPFKSFVHPSFWHILTDLKLEVDRLDERTKQIYGHFNYREDMGTVFEVDGTSFNKFPDSEHLYMNMSGTLMNKNTMEDFKSIDKAALLNSYGETLWTDVKNKKWIREPSILLNFLVISFADLKKFNYYYWFAFPSPSQPTVYLKESKNIAKVFNDDQLESIAEAYKSLESSQKPFFIISKDIETVIISPLAKVLLSEEALKNLDLENTYFSFTDPGSAVNPGWPLRLYLATLLEHIPKLSTSEFRVIGLRCILNGAVDCSRIFILRPPPVVKPVESAGWVGWERNEKGNLGPKFANMSASMDPIKMAEASSDLNIKLMKWRLVPDIDIEVMKTTKCLLLGAGTLGCHVARNLLAWGFRNITFIDNGKVSYSNPTRQVLFNFKDCTGGGRKKAEAAAENLKLIMPTVTSQGIAAHIPMPGHPVGRSLMEETIDNIETITEAIKCHDVIFLLLDTREARWLPTLLAAHFEKTAINAALGFDSYLVMRHGLGPTNQESGGRSTSSQDTATSLDSPFIEGSQLGCYFCNDVTAPGNSVKDRTLDQQCTVTRPGVAAIAGALAVEILVGLLQHPQRAKAPAVYNLNNSEDLPEGIEGILGPIPHSIRGYLYNYQTVLPTCAKFKQCIACSDIVIEKYRKEGIDFLMEVFNSGKYLEEVTGLTELQLAAEMTDILALSDED